MVHVQSWFLLQQEVCRGLPLTQEIRCSVSLIRIFVFLRIPPTIAPTKGIIRIFTKGPQNALDELRAEYSLRYVGCLVTDFHRNLLKGGVFLYPGTPKNPNGKLRLMYEANPLGFIAEQAGGAASSGTQPILDIPPQDLHQRTPLIVGNKDVVERTVSIMQGR